MISGGGKGWFLAAALPLGIAACARPPSSPPPVSRPVQTLGTPYSLRGLWYYPREDYGLNETGLVAVVADAGAGRRTTDGEVYDPAALTAAHRTVQLPAILRVSNLENGRVLLVRANDRGPADPGRLLALSRRAAELLGVAADRPAQVRVEVEPTMSRALAASLDRAPGESAGPAVAAAPSGPVRSESLAPPPGARQAAAVREGRGPLLAVTAGPAETGAAPPLRLPESVSQGFASPGRLLVQAGTFAGADPARRQAARLPGARAEPFGSGRQPEWRVRLGPFADAVAADGALEGVLRAGVAEARILVD